MVDNTTVTEEPKQAPQPRGRAGRCGACIGCVLAVVVAVGGSVWYVRSHERYSVSGDVDPLTGIGIEYTVSSHYSKRPDDEYALRHKTNDPFRDWEFTPKQPSPVWQWIDAHTLRQRTVSQSSFVGSDLITQTSSKHGKMTGWFVDPQGYVDINMKGKLALFGVVSQEHLMVRGCPTTLVVEDGDLIMNGHPNQYYDVLARPKGQSIIYMFQATGIEGLGLNPALRELKAIRDSIRVVNMK